MSEDKSKNARLFSFWLFGTVVIVFGAITAYITIFTGAAIWEAIKTGFPIWGITALGAIILYAVYYFLGARKQS
ncbi:MAG TPA: hypothetical protein ENN99_11975 [Chloroflexi bacterium]|nr:hypothetical protein [Chloroflexota bacterium]